MKEGDIYRWKWRDPERDSAAPYGDYHCKSQIAVFEGDKLFDTFWGSGPTDNSYLSAEKVELKLLGNRNELDVFSDREDFYDPEDLILMRHSNDTRAKTLIKRGARRSPAFMRVSLQENIAEAERNIQSAIYDLKRLAVAQDAIMRGKIDKIHF